MDYQNQWDFQQSDAGGGRASCSTAGESEHCLQASCSVLEEEEKLCSSQSSVEPSPLLAGLTLLSVTHQPPKLTITNPLRLPILTMALLSKVPLLSLHHTSFSSNPFAHLFQKKFFPCTGLCWMLGRNPWSGCKQHHLHTMNVMHVQENTSQKWRGCGHGFHTELISAKAATLKQHFTTVGGLC